MHSTSQLRIPVASSQFESGDLPEAETAWLVAPSRPRMQPWRRQWLRLATALGILFVPIAIVHGQVPVLPLLIASLGMLGQRRSS